MWHLATVHAQNLHSGWAYNRVKIPSCKNFEAKEGWAFIQDGLIFARVRTTMHTINVNNLLIDFWVS